MNLEFRHDVKGLWGYHEVQDITYCFDDDVLSLAFREFRKDKDSVLWAQDLSVDADHKNIVAGTGEAPTQKSIQAMILQMQKQTDQFGEPIYITPRKLIVPVGYEFDLAVIFRSAQVTGSDHNDINPLYNYPLQIVQTPLLNAMAGAGECPWFMMADEASARGIQVDYLNGQETPTVRRMETPGTLGFTWDIWLDWGISVRDFRGIAKNPGAVL
jgi:hypothetical protein